MVCPNCGSTNVLVTNEQTNGKTKTKKRGIIPNMLYKMLRLFCCLILLRRLNISSIGSENDAPTFHQLCSRPVVVVVQIWLLLS